MSRTTLLEAAADAGAHSAAIYPDIDLARNTVRAMLPAKWRDDVRIQITRDSSYTECEGTGERSYTKVVGTVTLSLKPDHPNITATRSVTR